MIVKGREPVLKGKDLVCRGTFKPLLQNRFCTRLRALILGTKVEEVVLGDAGSENPGRIGRVSSYYKSRMSRDGRLLVNNDSL